jgi:3-dehydroquinate synthase
MVIPVGTGDRGYAVDIEAGSLARLPARLEALRLGTRRVVITTAPVWRAVQARLGGALASTDPVLMPDGERFKHLATVSRLYDALLGTPGLDRATVILAVGGGVVGDTAGFVAATVLRGLPLVQVPTTLLAQVDAAIGGKVGVNHAAGKNLVGAFHPPRHVAIDPEVLATLPRREFRAGLYEVVKYGVIADAEVFTTVAARLDAVFARDTSVLTPLIAACCRIKAGVVTRDEREAGERRILNFGHTMGHALEAITRYRRFRHGEAVGYGMMAAARLAAARGALAAEAADALAALVAQMGPLPPVADLAVADAVAAIRQDKKIVEGRLHFVLPRDIGRVEVVDDVTEAELARALTTIGLRA